MKRPLSSRFIAAAVLAAAAFGAASTAQARTDVQLSIGFPGLPVYVQTPVYAPGYVRPAPVYVQPRPVYVPPVVMYDHPWRPAYRPDFGRDRDWRHGEWQRREWERRQWERRQWEHRHDDRGPSHGRGRD